VDTLAGGRAQAYDLALQDLDRGLDILGLQLVENFFQFLACPCHFFLRRLLLLIFAARCLLIPLRRSAS
jgi:hypothetical protein